MQKYILLLLYICAAKCSFAQLKGVVFGSDGPKRKPLNLAVVRLQQNGGKVLTNEEGKFELVLPKVLPDTLIISAKGYTNDTVVVTKDDRFIAMQIVLFAESLLPEVRIEWKRKAHSISRLKTLQVEELTEGELRKAACCNLSESFETNASVDVNITDAVSGAKKIQIMGLDGVYTQIQMENIPYLRGLESSFGLNSISGTWIESIQLTKGTGTVVNGYESMAGLVNIELKKPSEMERLYINGYGSIFGRAELNVNSGQVLNERWSTGTLVHSSGMFGEIDHNHDGFRDIPMGSNLALMNRWSYQGKKMEAQFGFNSYIDHKEGGQLQGGSHQHEFPYLVNLDSRHIDAYAKTGFFMKKPYNSIGVVYNVKYQTVNSLFGIRSFTGEEKRGYVNAIFDGIIGTTDHKIKVGLSGLYLDIQQQVGSLSSNRVEIVPGAFGEYTYTGSRLSAIAGARLDYHNLFGLQVVPRVHAKYILTEFTDLRFTAGKGWRVPNYMIDNVSLLASSKTWIASSNVLPEISWNIGGSLVQEFKLWKRKSTVTIDFYHTWFENQLIVDRDEQNTAVVFKSVEGSSYSNALQVEWSSEPIRGLEVRLAYKMLDVKSLYGGRMQQQVMIPPHRGLVHLNYISRNKRWEYSATLSIFGASRLPDVENQTTRKSETYPMLTSQLTHVYKRWDFYIGGENITNFKQRNAIVDPQNPFGTQFDATEIWGPIMGINVYAGFRYAIKRKK